MGTCVADTDLERHVNRFLLAPFELEAALSLDVYKRQLRHSRSRKSFWNLPANAHTGGSEHERFPSVTRPLLPNM